MSKVKLKEIGTFKNGLNFSADRVANGCKIIGIPNFGNRYFADLSNLSEVDNEIVPDECALKDGDILFVRSNGNNALVGRTMIISGISEKITFSGFCIRFRPNHEIAIPLYLLLLFKSPLFRKRFSTTQQTSINNINQEVLGEIEIDLPTKGEQKKTIDCIYPIIRKIEINNRINDNLEQMAFNTYMHLFFKKSPNGKLGEIIDENEKSTIQVGEAKEQNGKYPFFTSGDAILEWNSEMVDGRNCYLNTGGNAGVKFYIGKAAYSTDTWCITAKKGLADYIYLLLKSILPELSKKFFQGTGLKHLQKPLLKDRSIYIPSIAEVKDFNAQVQPMFDMISANIRENQDLIRLRDWLLPMLMNGQATVSD